MGLHVRRRQSTNGANGVGSNGRVTFHGVREVERLGLPVLHLPRVAAAGPSRLGRLGEQARRIAHDFRNLLLVADARIELAQFDVSHHSGAVASLDAARSALEKVRELTQLLDDLAQDAAPTSGAPVLVNLVDMVRDTSRELTGLLPITIHMVEDFQIEPAVWVRGDAGQLRRLIRNLVLNARDAMPLGGQLTLGVDRVRRYSRSDNLKVTYAARLIVGDTGVGMTPETRDRMFEPFFTTKADRGGTGLGLPIVREITAAHGARIEVDSTLGKGTQVCVTFPAVESAEAARRLPAGPSRSALGTVLVVGSDERLRSMAMGALNGGGTQVAFADSGREALSVLERERGAVRCLVVDAGTLPADEVSLLRAMRCWRSRRGLVLLLPAGAPQPCPVANAGECMVSRPMVFGELERSVRRALEGN
jgi:signal transduction histidine kinase